MDAKKLNFGSDLICGESHCFHRCGRGSAFRAMVLRGEPSCASWLAGGMHALNKFLIRLALCDFPSEAHFFVTKSAAPREFCFPKEVKKLFGAYIYHTYTYIIIKGNFPSPCFKLTKGVKWYKRAF